jgi:hypothetical protein
VLDANSLGIPYFPTADQQIKRKVVNPAGKKHVTILEENPNGS